MKNYLLTLPIVCMVATASMAQTTFDSAIEAQAGENKYTVTGDQSQTVYWKFTADKNYLATVTPLTGTAPTVGILGKNADSGEAELTAMRGATVNYPINAYPLQKGTTYYFSCTNLGETGFVLSIDEDDNIGGGITADAPAEIIVGKPTFLGDPFSTSYNGYNTYATYKATEDGQLVLASTGYMNATINGTSYSGEYAGSSYNLKVGVTKDTEYSITFNNVYSPLLVLASVAHPTAGSVDMPFEGKDGDNTLPAEYGKYYYSYTPQTTGFLTVSSDNDLPGGTVAIYDSKSSTTPLATSEQGTYNVRTEVAYTGRTYYIVVDKIDDTDQAETFRIAMEDYKAGEKESNPIVLEQLPATQTLEAATGVYYYSVNVPANTNKSLTVKAEGNVGEYTNVMVYPNGESWNGAYGTNYAECNVSNTYDRTYIIKWTANETKPLTFTVDYKDIKAGDLITNPITAVVGKNTLESDGTKYYAYTATRNGKLAVELSDPAMTVEFPRGTDAWSGTYEAIVNGITYSIEATQGTNYIITVKDAKACESFNLTEVDFEKGEVRDNPIDVEGTEYTLGKNQNNLWLKFTATKSCQLTVDCDAEYNGSSLVEFGKENEYMTGMVSTKSVGGNYESYFHGTKVLNAGEALLVHLKLVGNAEGYKVTFAEGDVPQGLTVENPLTIKVGETLTLPVGSEVWVKADLTKGTNTFKSNANNRTFLYGSEAEAKEGTNGEYVNYDTFYDPNDNYSLTATYTKTVDEDQTVYFQFPDVSYEFTFTFESNGTETAISDINAADNNTTTEVYGINGVKVAETTAGLKSGVYVLRQNGKTKKIIIK